MGREKEMEKELCMLDLSCSDQSISEDVPPLPTHLPTAALLHSYLEIVKWKQNESVY